MTDSAPGRGAPFDPNDPASVRQFGDLVGELYMKRLLEEAEGVILLVLADEDETITDAERTAAMAGASLGLALMLQKTSLSGALDHEKWTRYAVEQTRAQWDPVVRQRGVQRGGE